MTNQFSLNQQLDPCFEKHGIYVSLCERLRARRSVVCAMPRLIRLDLIDLSLWSGTRRYQLFPDLVVAVLMEDAVVDECFSDGVNCVKTNHNPDGIPLWKMFSFFFWTTPNHPMGGRWTLAPENYTMEHPGHQNNYLGYSVEPSCLRHEFIPADQRPLQAYVMAKKMSYFAPGPQRSWPLEFYDAAAEAMAVQLVAGVIQDAADEPNLEVPTALPLSIENRGRLSQTEFVSTVAHSRVLIGVGLPYAYVTFLCLPFVSTDAV